MKTKNVILSAVVVMFASVLAIAKDPGNPKLVVINQKSGVYKVIYEGAKAGKVSLKIYDKENKEVFAENRSEASGFIRPVNFEGMTPGQYTIEIVDANGSHTQKVDYLNEAPNKTIHVSKMAEGSKYLLAVANSGAERINVKIFDGSNNLVHNESININGNFGLVYDLKLVSGTPTFEISDNAGYTVTR